MPSFRKIPKPMLESDVIDCAAYLTQPKGEYGRWKEVQNVVCIALEKALPGAWTGFRFPRDELKQAQYNLWIMPRIRTRIRGDIIYIQQA